MILLNLNEELYENDLRALLMAFYPGKSIVRQEKEGVQIRLTVQYDREASNVTMTLETENAVIKNRQQFIFRIKNKEKLIQKRYCMKFVWKRQRENFRGEH